MKQLGSLTFVTSIFLTTACLYITGCKSEVANEEPRTPTQQVQLSAKVEVPGWAKNANIYEVNIRQYTKEGTINAFRTHLPRLQQMGVEILWLMPIHPISETKRKGTLGSYYAISDFRAVNPQFGTMRDFQELVVEVHNLGMRIILDWVPNHTGWDHVWIKDHPEYYTQDEDGNIIDPINQDTGEPWGWTDVADLNYDNPEMRKTMLEDMAFWVTYVDIDGFRCDVAHSVPNDFWDEASAHLASLGKPLFMLAESEIPEQVSSGNFIMNYGWELHHLMNAIAKGEKSISLIDTLLQKWSSEYPVGYQMHFTSNHDENSWAGTVKERMGDAHQTMAVLAFTLTGMPLIYSGQEEPLDKRLEFFEKDEIEWKDFAYAKFYETLLKLKKRNHALWNGQLGGQAERINTSDKVYAFQREKDGHKVVAILNLTGESARTTLNVATGKMRNVFTVGGREYNPGQEIKLEAWEYVLLSSI